MAQYTGIIVLDSESLQGSPMSQNYVKVRIPALHGPSNIDDYSESKISENLRYYTEDKYLPFAHILKPISTQGSFLPSEYFENGEVVLIEAVNDDLSNLLIIGKLGNYTATSDAQTIQDRINGINNSFGGANSTDDPNLPAFKSSASLISVAKGEIGQHDDGNNNVKYNTKYYGKAVSGGNYPWCCAFAWWCFNKAGLSQYFYGGNKTALSRTLMSYHNSKGEGMTNNFKAGDVLFINWTSKTGLAQHTAIAIEDQKGNTIKTVEGNISNSNKSGAINYVVEATRNLNQIVGGYRPGKSMSNEYQCFLYFTNTMGLNIAAACGILGNIYYESSFNTTTVGDKGTSYGLCQWHNGRYDNLKQYCSSQNMDYTQILPQLQYLQYELTNSYSYVLNEMRAVSNTSDGAYNAAAIWCRKFEIPANIENEIKNKRGPKAREYFNIYKK